MLRQGLATADCLKLRCKYNDHTLGGKDGIFFLLFRQRCAALDFTYSRFHVQRLLHVPKTCRICYSICMKIFSAFNHQITVKALTLTVAVGALFAFQDCNRQQTAPKAPETPLPATAQKLSRIDDETKAFLDGKHICVVLGYGYNDESFVEKSRLMLDRDYGVETAENAGLILLYVYPDDFDVGGKTRISKLTSLLDERKLAGILILGAPEGMNIPLAKLQDAAGGSLPYPVFSLFTQDDVLASEATADFVLDYAQGGETAALQEEVEVTQDFDADTLISNSIQEMISLKGAVSPDTNLLTFVQDIVGKNRAISHYTDVESGIQAANHFIFQ